MVRKAPNFCLCQTGGGGKVKDAPKFCTFGCFLKEISLEKKNNFLTYWPKYSKNSTNRQQQFSSFALLRLKPQDNQNADLGKMVVSSQE